MEENPDRNLKDKYTAAEKKISAIVLAAGSGRRMHSGEKKQFMDLCGMPVVVHSLLAFEKNKNIDSVVVVTAKEDVHRMLMLSLRYNLRKVKNIAEGGDMRFKSVYSGLKAVDADTDYILVHDGARPLVSQELIDRCCEYVSIYKACVAAVPVTDTIKIADDRMFIKETVDRSRLWAVQTPQAFSYSIFMRAYDRLYNTIREYNSDPSKITDDAMIVENMGDTPVHFVPGEYSNIKITTPEDMLIARAFIEGKDKNK